MGSINFQREITGELEETIGRLTDSLKEIGFGILTRIDFHSKLKEKLNKEIRPTVILGACNPALAFEAFQTNTNVTSLIPCNVVVRDVGKGKLSIEMAKPSFMMEAIGEKALAEMAKGADSQLKQVLDNL